METNPRDPVALQRTAEEASAKTGTSSVPARAGEPALKRTRVRYGILALLFFGVVINYLDRAKEEKCEDTIADACSLQSWLPCSRGNGTRAGFSTGFFSSTLKSHWVTWICFHA